MLVTTSVPLGTLSVLSARLYHHYRAKMFEQADADARQLRAIHAALDFPDDTAREDDEDADDARENAANANGGGGGLLTDNLGNGLALSSDEQELERIDEDKCVCSLWRL